MPWMNNREPDAIERLVSGLCYLSFGLVGLLYIILNGKGSRSDFFRFHFIQGIVLGIAATLLSWTARSISFILSGVLGLFGTGGAQAGEVIVYGIAKGVSLLSMAGFLIILYGMIMAFLGKYAEIYAVSRLVRQQMR